MRNDVHAVVTEQFDDIILGTFHGKMDIDPEVMEEITGSTLTTNKITHPTARIRSAYGVNVVPCLPAGISRICDGLNLVTDSFIICSATPILSGRSKYILITVRINVLITVNT